MSDCITHEEQKLYLTAQRIMVAVMFYNALTNGQKEFIGGDYRLWTDEIWRGAFQYFDYKFGFQNFRENYFHKKGLFKLVNCPER